MKDQQDPRHEQYERARDAFDNLNMEDKTVFLFKETVNTLFQGVGEVARSITDEFDAMFGETPPADTEAKEEAAAGNGAAKTSTGQSKAAPSKRRSTTRKTTTRKTTARKKPTAKTTAAKKDDSDDA